MTSAGDIRQVADVWSNATRHRGDMELVITLDRWQPPRGTVGRRDQLGDPESFDGWLDLLRSLEGLIDGGRHQIDR
jgi:hypothetical protein